MAIHSECIIVATKKKWVIVQTPHLYKTEDRYQEQKDTMESEEETESILNLELAQKNKEHASPP